MSNAKSDKEQVSTDLEEPGYVTKEELASIVNSAVTSHLKRFNFDKKLSEALETSLAPLREHLTAKESTAQVDKQAGPSAEVAALQKQLEAMQKQMKEKDLAVAAQVKASREKEAYGQLKSMLNGKVRPEAVDSVAKLLFHADKRVSVSDDGQMTYRADDDQEIDIQEGVKHYLKSKEASIFLPAPTAKATAPKTSLTGIQLPGRSSDTDPPKPTSEQAAALLSKLGLSLK